MGLGTLLSPPPPPPHSPKLEAWNLRFSLSIPHPPPPQRKKTLDSLYKQYYDDVYKLQQSNAQLADGIEQLQRALKQTAEDREMEAVQRDYDEFKQPDIDGDDRISRAEFAMYIKDYLSNYPGLDEKDWPRYEDFDHDGDGYISFQEYAQQMAIQVQKAEMASGR